MAKIVIAEHEYDIDAVGFDFNGTIRDDGYEIYRGCITVIKELGGTPPATFAAFLEELQDSDYDAFFQRHGVIGGLKRFIESFEAHFDEHDKLDPFRDVYPLLRSLRNASISAFVVSGGQHARIQPWLERHKLYEMLNHVRCGSRDKKRCITATCDVIGIAPAKTLFIGDWPLDVRESAHAGSIPIGITRGYASANALAAAGAAHVIDHLSEVRVA